MSKRHVSELSELYAALLRDATYAFPCLKDEFERDLTRLVSAVEQRGLPVLLVDLPAAGKHLDRCLDSGEYRLSGLPLTGRYSNRVVIPKLFRGLYLLIFDSTGLLKKDANIEANFFLRQLLLVGKKASSDGSFGARTSDRVKLLDQFEVREFIDVDRSLPIPEKFWSTTGPTISDVSANYSGWSTSTIYQERLLVLDPAKRRILSSFLKCLDKVSGIVSTTLGPFMASDWDFRHGPGAIAEVTGPTNKYLWRQWSENLECVFPIADYGFHNWSSWADAATVKTPVLRQCDDLGSSPESYESQSSISDDVGYSRLVAVPKSHTRRRLIAAEPCANQWCQQSLWHYFKSRTSRTWLGSFIVFDDQTRNQELCLRGSKDGSLATVDLSAASDRVTCHAVGQMFRVNPKLVLALQSTRTRFVHQKILERSETLIELRKFSTMGSACTFPVESLMFLTIALSAVLTARNRPATVANIKQLADEVTVFGDDIVIPTDARELLFEALEVLHFKVNVNKSFWTGRFRESCGVDAFAGVDVTPAFWRSPSSNTPDSIASTVAVRNNFYSKFLLHAAQCIATTMRRVSIPYTTMGSGVTGFKSRVKPDNPNLKVRYNPELQRMESLITVVETKVSKTPVGDDSACFQYFTERPDPFSKWSSGVAQRPVLNIRHRWVESDALVN